MANASRPLSIGINARFAADETSGLGGFVANLVRGLAALGSPHRFTLYAPGPLPPLSNLPANFETRIVMPGERDGRAFDTRFTLDPGYRDAVPDVLYLPHFKLPKSPGAARVVMTLHDIIPVVFLRPGMLLRGRTPARMVSSMGLGASLVEPFLLRRAAQVIAISAASRDDIARCLFYPRDRIHVIPNGFDTSFAAVTDPAALDDVRRRYGITRPFCLNFGGLVVRKNLGRQLAAWRALPDTVRDDLDFLVAGEGFWKGRLEREITKHGLAGRVRLLGRIERADLRALATLASFTCYVSLYEGFGFPILESLHCGTPVLCADSSSMKELVPAATRRVDPYDARAIAAGMADLCAANAEWRSRVEKHRPALAAYDWNNAARAYLESCEQAAAVG